MNGKFLIGILMAACRFAAVAEETAVIPALNFEASNPLTGWQVHGKGDFVLQSAGDGHALALNYDFREAIDTQFRHYWDRPQDLRNATGLRFRVRGDGSGQMLRLALICGNPQVDAEVFGRRVPILLEFIGWKEFFIPWEDFYLVPEYRDRISILVFMMDYLNTRGPQQSTIEIDDVAFTDREARPAGFVELSAGAASVGKDEIRPDLDSIPEAAVFSRQASGRGEFLTLALPLRGNETPESIKAEWDEGALKIKRADKKAIYSVQFDK